MHGPFLRPGTPPGATASGSPESTSLAVQSQEDDALIQALRRGDQDAFVALVSRYYPAMLALALLYMQGRTIRVAKLPMNYLARALEVDEPRGFMKAMVDADNQQILGCAVLGLEGGEIIAIFQMAMMGRLPYTVLRAAVFAHPTLADSLNNLIATLDDGTAVTTSTLRPRRNPCKLSPRPCPRRKRNGNIMREMRGMRLCDDRRGGRR